MNAVVRTDFAENSFVHSGALIHFNLPKIRVLAMVLLLLISALSIVYVKDLNRRLFMEQHKLQIQNEQLKAEGNKLLLDQSAWAAQARVQKVAQQQLQMKIPPSVDIVVIKA
jgi:cell division protein FtsL